VKVVKKELVEYLIEHGTDLNKKNKIEYGVKSFNYVRIIKYIYIIKKIIKITI